MSTNTAIALYREKSADNPPPITTIQDADAAARQRFFDSLSGGLSSAGKKIGDFGSSIANGVSNFDWQQNIFPGVFKPDSHPALVAARADAARGAADRENALRSGYGRDIRHMLGYGLAAGAGVTALWHLLRSLRQSRKKDRRSLALTTGAPVIAKEASIDKVIGGLLPQGVVPLPATPPGTIDTGSSQIKDPNLFRPSWGAVAALTAGGLGAYGGHRLINYIMKQQKKKNNEEEIEAARQEYYNALRGDSKEAQALDATFDALNEKTAEGEQTSSALQRLFAGVGDAVHGSLQLTHGAGLLAMLGAGLYGGKAVYDWTKARSAGENLAKAQASRARMKNLPPIWVDPEELVRVKELANTPTDE